MGYIYMPKTKNLWDRYKPVLLLHADGANGGTTFKDSSPSNHSMSRMGSSQTSTAQKKFGVSSCWSAGYVYAADSSDWCMGTGLFTIDSWFRFSSLPDVSHPTDGLWQNYQGSGDRVDFALIWSVGDSATALRLQIYSGGNSKISFLKLWSPSLNTWYHIALIRGWAGNANDWAATIDGTLLDAAVTDVDAWPDLTGNFEIGRYGSGTAYMDGYWDELHIVKGNAVWTANFIPPSTPYPSWR